MKPLTYLGLLLLILTGAARADDPATERSKDPFWGSFDRFDRELKEALRKQDVPALALLVKFPLRLNHPDGSTTSLDTPRTLQLRFSEAFPPAIRQAVQESKPGDFINKDVGVGYKDGALWTEEVNVTSEGGTAFRVATINLPGAEPPAAGAALQLAFVCETAKHRAVVELDSHQKARYRVWNKPHSPLDKPDLEILDGVEDGEGTSACYHRFWTFRTGKTTLVVSERGCAPGGEDAGDSATGFLTVSVGGEEKSSWLCY